MMAAVPSATVVITHPTHFAVALRRERGMNTPICVARGQDVIALKIREIAAEHRVPVVENPPLARTCTRPWRWTRRFPPSTTRRWPRSSPTDAGPRRCAAAETRGGAAVINRGVGGSDLLRRPARLGH